MTSTSDPSEGDRDEKKREPIRLPNFGNQREIGLGDLISSVASRMHVPPCGGCGRRAERLNRLVTFAPRTKAW